MTYTVKTRGAGGYLVAEYICPHHGVFEATVQRDENGDAPDEQPCPEVVADDGMSFVDAPSGPACITIEFSKCGERSTWTISAPKTRVESVPCYAAVRGGDMTERPAGMLDTRDLADGKVTYTQWKAKQAEAQRARRHKQLIDKGVTQRKIQVG